MKESLSREERFVLEALASESKTTEDSSVQVLRKVLANDPSKSPYRIWLEALPAGGAEKGLLRGVIARAAEDSFSEDFDIRVDAWEWFLAEDCACYPWTFDWVCEQLGLSGETIRQALVYQHELRQALGVGGDDGKMAA